ncbi:Colicin V production protein [hydrothermal vent metagenome]|uniref:Colicin V production protein n=1 Tax=hydrothermal vent metagenome TaxID=652676 RepID=A0A3B1BAK1_9ZZZZ
MIWVDYIIIGIIALSALISLVRGFMREALSLMAWVLAFWVSWTFFRELAVYLESSITVPSVRFGVSFILLMIVTLVIGGLVNYLVGQLVEKTGLTGTDRMIGMFFGAARGALLVGIAVLLAGLTAMPADPWWHQSVLTSYFQDLAIWLRGLLPPDIADKFRYA